MLIKTALSGMSKYKEALLENSNASNPSLISEYTHKLTAYISSAEDYVTDLEYDMTINEAELFKKYLSEGNSANASKELIKREFIKDRATIAKINRLVASGWKIVSESQSRVKHLIAEANNQI